MNAFQKRIAEWKPIPLAENKAKADNMETSFPCKSLESVPQRGVGWGREGGQNGLAPEANITEFYVQIAVDSGYNDSICSQRRCH